MHEAVEAAELVTNVSDLLCRKYPKQGFIHEVFPYLLANAEIFDRNFAGKHESQPCFQ